MLEQERKFYQDNIETWLAKYPGKFVVIKGNELIGVFDTMEAALSESARLFGLDSLLVRRVERMPQEIKIPALTLGLISANS
ncbi:hypothetical protein TFLX_02790 [Thermoflexales bacterium]|nr:hypothetical protein TFLX_02790 [Thermoflexales bacterium]